MKIRKENQADSDAIARLNDEAFSSREESKFVEGLRASGNLYLSLVAEEKGEIVGHIAFSPVVVEGHNLTTLVGLAPMSVNPKFQGKGIGSDLVRRSIEILRDQGMTAIFVLGHPGYYPRFGFKPASSHFGIRSTYDVSDDVFMAVELEDQSLDGINGVANYCAQFNGK